MDHRIASTRPLGRALTAALATAALALGMTLALAPAGFAQAPPPTAPAAPAKKPAPAKPAPAQPAQAQPPQQPPQQAGADVPQLMYTPWVKMCGKGQETNNKQLCITSKDGRVETGMPVVMAQLFEPEGEQKVLRIVVPIAMLLQPGTRFIIDQQQPMQAPYKLCIPSGCMSEYPITDDIVGKMKKGQMLMVQAINMQGQAISLPLPLGDFAKAYDGPATDPKVFEEQQRKLQEALQAKAAEAQKRLEGQQPAGQAPAPK